jgi:HAD superfamily hydrolase (TIGR01509 family)
MAAKDPIVHNAQVGRRHQEITPLGRNFDAVIFDMDGTLIEQMLDFAAIRAELGVSQRNGILEAIQQMPPAQGEQASRRLLEIELAAARKAVLLPGAAEIVQRAGRAGLKTALLTRNAQEAMEAVMELFGRHGMTFDLALSRQDGPIKPEPDGILRACRRLGVQPQRTCCVGDFLYDIVAANAAGATSVLLARRDCQYADQADYVISEVGQLVEILGV